mmetsp:Transcript_129253/g.359947  ORF Transcript_129253/g.359947 Transcript_129253/m.359947 type:complete len:255 (-) Transcript_129253:93-857(-)
MWCCGLYCLLPVRGVLGFLSTPELYRDALLPFSLLALMAVAVLGMLFAFTFEPQVHLVERLGSPAWFSDVLVVILIFVEVMVGTFLAGKVVCDKVVEKIQHHVLEERGVMDRLKTELGIDHISDVDCCLGHVAQNILFAFVRLMVMLVTLPVNSCPVLGTVLWLLVNGWLYAWELTGDLLPAFGYTNACGQGSYAMEHRITFGTFGAVALALTLVPLVGPLFLFTNAYGAVLLFEALLEQHGASASREGYQQLE